MLKTFNYLRLTILILLIIGLMTFDTQAQISAHFTCPSGNQSQTFNFTGSLQTFTVPAGITELIIYGAGATGGSFTAGGLSGGTGGVVGAKFTVTPGEALNILVGEHGEEGFTNGAVNTGAGGGGGSFVFKGAISLANLLLASGGGGGSNTANNGGNSDGTLSVPGDFSDGGQASGGSGGAGITGDGLNNGTIIGGKMIIAPGNGAKGTNASTNGNGGYGGGGAGELLAFGEGGGGGSGYLGGDGGIVGGNPSSGGTSFIQTVGGTQLFFNAGGNPAQANVAQNGQVLVCYQAPIPAQDPIPTMSQWGLIIFGLLVLNLGVMFVNKQQAISRL